MSDFARQPLSPRPGPVASTTPLRDHLAQPGLPGVLEDYLVLPRVLAEAMPLAWQTQLATLLAELHHAYRGAPWPGYAVAALLPVPLTGCNEEQLAAVDVQADLDDDGAQLTYRDRRTGAVIEHPDTQTVLVKVADPLRR
jgi:hypothetical protein